MYDNGPHVSCAVSLPWRPSAISITIRQTHSGHQRPDELVSNPKGYLTSEWRRRLPRKQSRKEQRQEYMSRRARELAASGDHIDNLTIENALIREGYPEARTYLDRNSIRQDLKEICDRAREARRSP